MQLKKREIEGAFNKLRMDIAKTHHKMAYFEYEGVQYLKTRISHGKGDIPKSVIARIRKQLELNQIQFTELVKCPLGYNEYVEILKEKGIIPR